MAHRVNVMLDDRVWEELQKIPPGERSKLVNEVVSEALLKRRQREAWAAIETVRKSLQPVPGRTEDWMREDRDSHQ
jgi:hypothetical protein